MVRFCLILVFMTLQWLHVMCVQLIQLQQDPEEMILSPGSSLKVSCFVTGTDDPYLYWYQWTPAEGFTLVFTSVTTGSVDSSSKGQFKSQRPGELQIVLESDGWFSTLCAQVIQVHQNPEELIVSPGSPLKVFCSITGIANPYLYWYQWTPAAGFTLVFTSLTSGSVNPQRTDQFKSSRPGELQIVLESDGVSESDSAVWYCAASLHRVPD
ncbi:hypothetical protein SRHO_G00137670 [Serrasalmus rhombeus]